MNPIELKAYILNHVKDANDVEITMNEDASFYVKVKESRVSDAALEQFLSEGHDLVAEIKFSA